MVESNVRRLRQTLLLGCLLISVLFGCSPFLGLSDRPESAPELLNEPETMPKLRGVWMQARSITTSEGADEMLARLEAGHFNAVFVNVFAYGHAYYESKLLKKHPDVAPSYDPLAYFIEQAHRRDIAVHAWLVAGPVGFRGGPGPVLTQHPDWAMVGPDGQQSFWLNYTRPDVREFISDLVQEIVEDYDVDGVHFDYTRYPGSGWGFDPYSAELFAQEYGADLELLRYPKLPAYATFAGNPLAGVDTAQVLAVFDDGQPALLLNSYGAGKVILLNWDAGERQVAASSEILDRSINYLLDENGKVSVLHSETNAAQYGSRILDQGVAWLEDLGWQPIETTSEAGLSVLNGNDVLVMPYVYLIGPQVASDLADFVHAGGGVVFIDGPTRSIGDENVQAITGMRKGGNYFRRPRLLIATQEHEIIPNSTQTLALEDYQVLHSQWKMFREQGINKLLQEVYRRIKQENPDVLVSITVSGDQGQLVEEHLLDWQTWLDGGYVDLIIPRAYVDQDELLAPPIANWRPHMENSDRIALGLQVYTREGDNNPKTPERILGEITLARAGGSNGILLFDIERISDDMLAALAVVPFWSLNPASD